ncbi:MAG TPA: hypothetical protein VG368_02730 [Acidimicrobiales bacterium]|jgi:hypothetical protein|nr:hypothetical protein [Acidimicrobiales bacterium]
MNGWSGLERFLTTDPDDAGCTETFEIIDVYVELTLRGESAASRLPRVAAHLRSCHPCAEDFEGLLLAVGS